MRMETKVSKGISKRLASWLLVFAMIAAMVPLSGLALDDDGGGFDDSGCPYGNRVGTFRCTTCRC